MTPTPDSDLELGADLTCGCCEQSHQSKEPTQFGPSEHIAVRRKTATKDIHQKLLAAASLFDKKAHQVDIRLRSVPSRKQTRFSTKMGFQVPFAVSLAEPFAGRIAMCSRALRGNLKPRDKRHSSLCFKSSVQALSDAATPIRPVRLLLNPSQSGISVHVLTEAALENRLQPTVLSHWQQPKSRTTITWVPPSGTLSKSAVL
jgi:hypothetical protein